MLLTNNGKMVLTDYGPKQQSSASRWRCFYCGVVGAEDLGPDGRFWHVDHVYPISRGGDDKPDNHVLSCASCNLGKRTLSAMEYFARKSQDAPLG